MAFLMPPHPLTNFEIQRYYENEPRFNGVFSRNNLALKIKDGAYVINLDKYAGVGTHWIVLFCNKNEIVYSGRFGVEHAPKEIKVGLSPSEKSCAICLVESLVKMMKNAFYFILKALFVLKIFKLLSRLFGHVGNID